ncbi:uncharacterized protein LOC115036253 isoform X2 [Echeneis naucrates]|uniref:uncharacterized protein LOC115036253 isoform X2 n=1 Tax=Echeneis naucrates TaxID=173247 RepID=UPI0011139075|nr:uncharacterized protein LOC115036253 isoform X2 [Echeneis naucrates]
MRPHGVFTVLVLVLQLWAVSAVTVPPPTNLKLTCENVKATVSWDYEPDQPETSFIVHITSSAGNYTTETSEHHYDLTPFVWKSVEHFTGGHSVNVTAVRGGRKSRPAKSKTFSFVFGRSVGLQCNLSFPPVDVTKRGATNEVSFQNPLHFYKELQRAAEKNTNVVFEYNVSEDFSECRAGDPICRSESTEECVTLEGRLIDRTEVHYVMFNRTEQICLSASRDMQTVTLVILLCVFFIVVTLISVLICQTRAWILFEKHEPPPVLTLDGNTQVLHFMPQKEETNQLSIEDTIPLVAQNDRAELDHCGAERTLRSGAGPGPLQSGARAGPGPERSGARAGPGPLQSGARAGPERSRAGPGLHRWTKLGGSKRGFSRG